MSINNFEDVLILNSRIIDINEHVSISLHLLNCTFNYNHNSFHVLGCGKFYMVLKVLKIYWVAALNLLYRGLVILKLNFWAS